MPKLPEPPEGPPDTKRTARLQTAMTQLSEAMEQLVGDTMDSLTERGIDPGEMDSLLKLRDTIRALHAAAAPRREPAETAQTRAERSFTKHDKRTGKIAASEALLARASATIDILVQSGHTPEHAAQLVTRQLLSVGVVLPQSGGDARAWKRLHNWRDSLIHRRRAGPAWDVYCAFRRELAEIPPSDRLRRVVGERLWDQRRAAHSSRDSA